MRLHDSEPDRVLFCVGAVQRCRRDGLLPGSPQAPWLVDLIRRLELEVTTPSVSRSRQDSDDDPASLKHEDDRVIGSREAATLLAWDVRQVQRRRADLDGWKLDSGRLVFHESAVREYAEEMRNDDRPVA